MSMCGTANAKARLPTVDISYSKIRCVRVSRVGQSAAINAAEMSSAQTQDEPEAANAVHHTTAACAREEVPRTTVPVDRRASRILRVPQSHRNTGMIIRSRIVHTQGDNDVISFHIYANWFPPPSCE